MALLVKLQSGFVLDLNPFWIILQDRSNELIGFESRLLARDRGCVVCMAQRPDDSWARYSEEGDSELFIEAHIFPLQYYELVRFDSLHVFCAHIRFSGIKKR